MSKEIKVVNCTAVELKNLIKESVKQELATLTNNNQQQPTTKLLTRTEVCDILQINPSTLWKWTKEEKLPCHRIGNRVYYKLKEVEECLTKSI